MCYIFYKIRRKQCAATPSFVLLSDSTGNSKNQKQVLNVCYFLAGLNSARNWCSNQRTCEYMYKCFGLFSNYCLFNESTA